MAESDVTGTGEQAGRRDVLIEAIASIVLTDGVGVLGLRMLAARLSTSGRMLIYYFGSREALVLAVLGRVSERMAGLLVAHSSGPRLTPGVFVAQVLALADTPEVAPFMHVWTDVVARGARGEAPYGRVAAELVGSWLDWIESRLVPADGGRDRAVVILSIVEGMTLLEMARPGTTAVARTMLRGALDGTG